MSSSDSRLPRLRLWLTLCVLGAACARAPGSEMDPHPQRLVPAWGLNANAVPVRIEGENFLALPTQHIGGEEPVTVDARFEAFLDDVALEDVTLEDSRTLRATVPVGLAPGWHSLEVVGPLGRRVELPRAYYASDRPLAVLGARASLERDKVSVGERTWLVLTVENSGGTSALAVTPRLSPVGEGQVKLISQPAPADIPPGTSASFSWELGAVAPGDLRFLLEAGGIESQARVELQAPGVEMGPLRMRNRAALTSSLTVSPAVVNAGQWMTLTLRLTNPGEIAVLGVVPGTPVVSGSLAVPNSGPEPESVDIPAGESRELTWTYVAGPEGTLAFQVGAVGRDGFSGVEVLAPEARSPDVTVQVPGALSSRFTSVPMSVNVGQLFDVELEVRNPGDATVLGAKLEGMGCTSQVVLVSGPEPASVDIPGGDSRLFRARLAGAGEGSCAIGVVASGVDQTSGAVVKSPSVTSPLNVRRPAQLALAFSAPSRVAPGRAFKVSLAVTNTGSSMAQGVLPGPPVASSSVAVFGGADSTSPVDLAGGASATFSWNYRADHVGQVFFTGGVSGIDGTSGAEVASGNATSGNVRVVEAEQLISNPLGDGSPFAQVVDYNGRLHVGPNRNGTGGVSLDLDGLGGRSFGFFLYKDTAGSNLSQNTSASSTYSSVGATGCAANTAACGPDNEDGRGFFFSGRVGTQPWLGIGGARSGGDLDYVYLGQDTDDLGTMYLRYLDLSLLLGGQTKGFSAALFFQDRLYLGFPDGGGSRPYLVVAKRLPTADPGLDASVGVDAENLQADKMPGVGSGGSPSNKASVQMIDTLTAFNDRLYVANNGGCMRSTSPTPRAYGTAPADWASCTPSLSAWSSLTSKTTPRTADLEPADRAVPGMAVFQGRLYLARNTTVGPQLFMCTPGTSGSTTDCDPGDWSLVAANSTGNTQLTQFDEPGNTALSLLMATSRSLFVGFNNGTKGAVVLRSSGAPPIPTASADFVGKEGCSAAQLAAGCEGVGGNGLGAGATRLFDGVVAGAAGSESLYLTAGDGTGPVGLYRLPD
ncbi:hypothetical protein [Archangium sp.]|uniref:hypothetical protein n=1 Tax=Archangium sp. TaxID=1872627 RepID=UPI003899A456